ncbi:hypothetical protein B0H14DRAFT_3514219 [Mycena olivaceomarginata]|nr:hypothetical protein B0H14DRAFT_3514219 [Mycena olivaceomarginata]
MHRGRRSARRARAPPSELGLPPIHERSIAADPQAASPLYNGLIPPEICNTIFAAILTEYTPSDPSREYPPSVRRPGYTGPRTTNIAFLLTCRRIYLETYHLPPQLVEHVFWHAPSTGPPGLGAQYPNIHGSTHEADYFARLTPWQLSFVRELKLFTQMYWLDDDFANACAGGDIPASVERLKITVRRGDWWYNERYHPFTVNPYRGRSLDLAEYNRDVAREVRGETIPWAANGWGGALQRLPALKELEMEFEMSVDRQQELEKVVERALRWKFPMGKRGMLSNKGLGMELSKWQSGSDSFCVFTVKWQLVQP